VELLDQLDQLVRLVRLDQKVKQELLVQLDQKVTLVQQVQLVLLMLTSELFRSREHLLLQLATQKTPVHLETF